MTGSLIPNLFLGLLCALAVSGCTGFTPDQGFSTVAEVTGGALGKDTAFVRTPEDARRVEDAVRQLLLRPLTADTAVQIALLNNRGLQAAYNELALSEVDRVSESLPPNPAISISSISGNGALEIERRIAGDILALATLPARSDVARERFRKAQLRAADETLRLAADVRRAYIIAVAANELVMLLTDAVSTAESTARLAARLGETGSLNRLDQAREQAFYAETAADLAAARQAAASAREALIRLLGLWDDEIDIRLPRRLPGLPARARPQAAIEIEAVEHRLDLQMARIELLARAKSLDLAQASRFVTMLDLAGIERKTGDPGAAPFRERGFDVGFQIPIFDGGEVGVRQAVESYNHVFNRLAERAVNVRSEARDAYRIYRSTYDIAAHYQREVLPLRKIISDEMQLRLSSMQVDVFALLTESRQRLAARRAAVEARRAFWLAQSELLTVVHGGARTNEPSTAPGSRTTPQALAGAQ